MHVIMLYGWEGNCRSGAAHAMCHRLSGIPIYGLICAQFLWPDALPVANQC